MKEIDRIILKDEEICLKKSFDGWRVVHPWTNVNGTRNWNNILIGGSWWNLVKVLFIVGIILFMVLSYKYDLKECLRIAEFATQHPCEWCNIMQDAGKRITNLDDLDINWSQFLEKEVIEDDRS